jgi:hypothetical protein
MALRTLLAKLLISLVALSLTFLPSSALAASVPKGWKAYTAGDLSFGLPANWRNVPLDKAALKGLLEEVEANNPELAAVFQGLLDSGQYKLLKFFGIDTDTGQNLNVAVTPVGVKLKPSEIVGVLEQQLTDMIPNSEIVETHDDIKLNGTPAALIVYRFPIVGTDGTENMLYGYQYYVPVGTNINIVTITGDETRAFRATVEQIAKTIDLAKATAPTATVKTATTARATAATSGKSVDKLAANEVVTLLGKNKAGTWLKVTTPRKKTGWVIATALKLESGALGKLKVVS